MRREPLPAPSVQRAAALPPPRTIPQPAPQAGPSAEDAPEPVLGRIGARGARHHRGPARAPPPGHRPGRRPALRPAGVAPVDLAGAPGAGRRPCRVGQPDTDRARRARPGPHPRPLREPAGQQRGGAADHALAGGSQGTARGGGPAGRPDRADPGPDRGHLERPPVQPLQAGAGARQRPPVGHPLHQGAPGRLPGGVLGPDHRAQLPPAGADGPGPARLPGGPDARLRLDHQRRRAPVAVGRRLPAGRRLRAVGARIPVRARAARDPWPPGARGRPGGSGGRHPEDDTVHGRGQRRDQPRHQPAAGG